VNEVNRDELIGFEQMNELNQKSRDSARRDKANSRYPHDVEHAGRQADAAKALPGGRFTTSLVTCFPPELQNVKPSGSAGLRNGITDAMK